MDTETRGYQLLRAAAAIPPPREILLRGIIESNSPDGIVPNRITPSGNLNRVLSVYTVLPPPPVELAEPLLLEAVTETTSAISTPSRASRSALFATVLVRHLGRIALFGLAPRAMDKANRLHRTTRHSRIEAQTRVIGVNEESVGRHICRNWQLPREFCDPISHEAPPPLRVAELDENTRRKVARCAAAWTQGWLMDQSEHYAVSQGPTSFNFDDNLTDPVASLASIIQKDPADLPMARRCQQVAEWIRRVTHAHNSVCALHLTTGQLDAATDRRVLFSPASNRNNSEAASALSAIAQTASTSPTEFAQAPTISRNVFANSTNDTTNKILMMGFRTSGRARGVLLINRARPAAIARLTSQLPTIAAMLSANFDAALHRERVQLSEDMLLQCTRRDRSTASPHTDRKSSAVLARMAAGAAHELNNPLTVISGRAQLLLSTTSDPTAQKNLQAIYDQARRASGMVNELIETAKPSPSAPERIRLSDLADRTRQYWYQQKDVTSASCQIDLSDRSAQVWADPDQLELVYREIVDNVLCARKSENIHLKIESPSFASDESIVLSVRDDGRGMTPDVAANAFDPFFSFREAGRGRGLGLTRALRLVEANGGAMWIESVPEVGTTVHVALPSPASRHTPRTN